MTPDVVAYAAKAGFVIVAGVAAALMLIELMERALNWHARVRRKR